MNKTQLDESTGLERPSGTVKQGRRPMYKSFVTQRDEIKAHADKLSETLRLCVDRLKWLTKVLPDSDSSGIVNLSESRLAAYEAAQ